MYEIIDNWNSANKSLREEENFKAFKRKIMEIQNSFVRVTRQTIFTKICPFLALLGKICYDS